MGLKSVALRLVEAGARFTCNRCHVEKDAADFRMRRIGHGGFKLRKTCNACMDLRATEWRLSNQERFAFLSRRHNISKFGITLTDYDRMLVSQNGVCAICRRPETSTYRGKVRHLAVDHCHATGKVRGLLCHKCNLSIGQAGDDPVKLRAMADYIERAR